jgi:phosphoribosylformylglycinamidine synthase
MTAFATDAPIDSLARRVRRVEVHMKPGQPDSVAAQYLDELRKRFGEAANLSAAAIYLIESPLSDGAIDRVAHELLADPITQQAVVGITPVQEGKSVIEVHYLPGVMDPVAQSTREAVVEMSPGLSIDDIEVRTGWRFDLIDVAATRDELVAFAQQQMANTVIQEIHASPFLPEAFPHGHPYLLRVTQVAIRDLDDDGLKRMSRHAHLFLSLDEMRAVRDHYRELGREPNDIELETLAQTWSEHCVHKTLKATIRYREGIREQGAGDRSRIPFEGRPGHTINPDGSITIHNLLKSTIAAATKKLTQGDAEHPPVVDWCVSVFVDNAGIIKFDEVDGVCIKVETHNHPSAIEPYGGAATGIGGCIRDVMGTGLAARPIANMDVFCVAHPERDSRVQSPQSAALGQQDSGLGTRDSVLRSQDSGLPKGVIHPRRVLQRVVAGVRDYGNRMGIPTVNGAVWFHDDYLGNPLVFAGCVGLIPLDKCFGKSQPGDRIIALGGRTGRDGIHGATFSSAELTDTHADEFSHAVQIGNAITQKKTMDVILQARDHAGGTLFNAITDCGAGGFSSAIGEMGSKIGAHVTLETAPLKYRGLSYTEVWISEAQERMMLAVPPANVEALRRLCDAENVEMCDLGQFGWPVASAVRTETTPAAEGEGCVADATGEVRKADPADPILLLTYHGTEVGKMSMHFLHEGIPMPTREAEWKSSEFHVPGSELRNSGTSPASSNPEPGTRNPELSGMLYALLSHPNIASKHWIIRQYDHEVQGGSVIKPLVGPCQDGPGDAAVLRPKLDSNRGLAIGCGLAPNLGEKAAACGFALDGDSYWMALAGIDEAVRNVVCAGADPTRIAILDNFCWPKCEDPKQLGAVVRAAEGCYDGALAYKTPFVSGKDSLSNQFTKEDGSVITIPQTLLITAMGIVPDVLRSRTMDAKSAGNALLLIGDTTSAMGGSHLVMLEKTGGRGQGTGDGGQATDRAIRNPKSEIRNLSIPRVDLTQGPRNAAAVAKLIAAGLVASAHDCSDGGMLVAAAEMAFAGRVGLDLNLAGVPTREPLSEFEICFAETPSRYLIEVATNRIDAVIRTLRDANIPFGQVGTFATHDRLTVRSPKAGRLMEESLDALRDTWKKPLDW